MAKASAGKKKKKEKARKVSSSKAKTEGTERSRAKPKSGPASARKPAAKPTTAAKAKKRAAATAKGMKRVTKTAKVPTKGKKKMAVEEIKRLVLEEAAPEPEQPPRLLSESKRTQAALGQLEKAIKFIHQRDFSKANAEFEALIENYPGEPEIVASARRYQSICERESRKPRKAPASSDQVYSLAIMEHNRGAYDKAIGLFRDLLAKQPEADFVHYSIAASFARKGSIPEAIGSLKRAIELNSDNRIYAKNESDFSSLHNNRDFADLVGMNPIESGEP